MIVLGILSYLLDLQPDQIATAGSPTAETVVIVDDCALSGARLADAVERTAGPRLVAAVLLAPAPLIAKAVAAEERLDALIVGDELGVTSSVSESSSKDTSTEIQQLAQDLGRHSKRYWLGRVEPIAFPWSEPEQVFASSRRHGVDDGWRSRSPLSTLRGRGELATTTPRSSPRFEHPNGIFWRWDDDGVMFWRADVDRVSRIDSTGKAMWRVLLSSPSRAEAIERLARRLGNVPSDLPTDLDEFANRLVDAGLLRSTS